MFARLQPLTYPMIVCVMLVAGTLGTALQAQPPLGSVTTPDVNVLGLLDKSGPGAGGWEFEPITVPGNVVNLQRLGKAVFWDMQVGGDGIQACATCHYHAGADHRKVNQLSPGIKAGDSVHDLSGGGPNGVLTRAHYAFVDPVDGLTELGLPVDEQALMDQGAIPDAVDGTPVPGPGGVAVKAGPASDVNDVVSSQGVRSGTFHHVSPTAVDAALLANHDPGFVFNFLSNAAGVPDTVRRVEPRNAPTVLNAVSNFRNFWDGRADVFFNGVNPFGFRDPDARVKVYTAAGLGEEQLMIPFSSLASQAVGPIESDFEMTFSGRSHRDLGVKMSGATPLAGQQIDCSDSLLGALIAGSCPGEVRGINTTYADWIKQIFDERFWGDGSGGDVCLDGNGDLTACGVHDYTLLEWNFSLFFGLSVQAYEALLVTERTIVDLIAGGIATGVVTNGRNAVDVAGLPLENCIDLVARNNSPAQQAVAEDLCTAHYAVLFLTERRRGASRTRHRIRFRPGLRSAVRQKTATARILRRRRQRCSTSIEVLAGSPPVRPVVASVISTPSSPVRRFRL